MSAIDAALASKLNAGFNKTDETPSQELGQSEFFQLMLAQLKNQDPTKPLDGQQYLAQLAQFSTVNGIQELNQSFNQLTHSLQSLHALQASSMVGRSVMIESNAAYLGAEGSLRGSVNLSSDVNNLTLVVTGSGGREVRRIELGQQAAGEVEFGWDGITDSGVKATPGVYHIRVEGRLNNEVRDFTPQIQASVQSVSLAQGGQGMTLYLAGLGEVDISEIRAILA